MADCVNFTRISKYFGISFEFQFYFKKISFANNFEKVYRDVFSLFDDFKFYVFGRQCMNFSFI